MSYVFKYTEANGFKQVNVSKRDHNQVFKNRRIKWYEKYEYFLNEETDQFVMINLTNLPAKLLSTALYPVALILNGVVNYKELNREIYNMWNQKETGSFSGDASYRRNDGWDEIMAIIKT